MLTFGGDHYISLPLLREHAQKYGPVALKFDIRRMRIMNYGFSKTVEMTFEQAIEKVTTELKNEGFGVLTSIDVKETLKQKIDVDFKKYTILGACNPPIAHKALLEEEELGLLLPCNVIVYEKDNKTNISVFDPMVMTWVIDNDNMQPIATEVKEKLQRVLEAV
jgi:uncharacterized protein (DUF302 family)